MRAAAEIVGWTVIALVGFAVLMAGMVAWMKLIERIADKHEWPSLAYAIVGVSPLILAWAVLGAVGIVSAGAS